MCALPRAVGTDYLGHIEGLESRDAPGGSGRAAICESIEGLAGKAVSTPSAKDAGATVWTAPFYSLRGGALVAAAEPAVQDYRENVMRVPVPFGILGRAGEEYVVGLSESYMCSVSHWVHVLRINSAAMAGWWVKRLRAGYVLGAFWLFWRFLCGFPWWGGRLFGAIRAISWGASVHHTAVVELSVVRKGATV